MGAADRGCRCIGADVGTFRQGRRAARPDRSRAPGSDRRRKGEDSRLLAAFGTADTKATEAIRAAISGLDARLDTIDARIAADYKEFAALSAPKPLAIAELQSLLRDNEAFVLYLDLARVGPLAEESLGVGRHQGGGALGAHRSRHRGAGRACGSVALRARPTLFGRRKARNGAAKRLMRRLANETVGAGDKQNACRCCPSIWSARTRSTRRCSGRSRT